MKINLQRTLLAICIAVLPASASKAANLLSPNDFIIAIDIDPLGSNSSYPSQEPAEFAGDGDIGTKYLNFGKTNTGFIVEPFGGPTIIQSMLLATANDAVERDPTSWKIYGTNDPITSVDNGTGSEENWTLIAEDTVDLTDERDTFHTPISFTNSTSYSAYRVLFPTVKDEDAANSMQIAEATLYESTDATGDSVWNDFDFPIAFQLPTGTANYNGGEGPGQILDGVGGLGISNSSSPAGEEVAKAIDGGTDKYLNFGGENSGFIVTPASGPTTVESFKFFTGNDFVERDPSSFELYGTNDAITSTNHSLGTDENWTLIDSGALDFTDDRSVETAVTVVSNSTAYSSYKMLFPTIKDPEATGIMQVGEVFMFENTTGSGFADILGPADAIIAVDADEIQGEDTKFLTTGGENSGFIVTPAAGSSIMDSFQLTTGNDLPGRDPASWELYGTDDSITSEDRGQGSDENWVLIDSGTFDPADVPEDRKTTGAVVSVSNTTEYSSYRMVFPTLRDNLDDGAMQIAGVEFFGEITGGIAGDFDGDGDVDGSDFLSWQRGTSPNNGSPADLVEWQNAYGGGAPLAASSAVPEPSTAVFTIFAALSVASGVLRRGAWGSASRR